MLTVWLKHLTLSVRQEIQHSIAIAIPQIAIGSRVVAELGLHLFGAFTICTAAVIQISICTFGIPLFTYGDNW